MIHRLGPARRRQRRRRRGLRVECRRGEPDLRRREQCGVSSGVRRPPTKSRRWSAAATAAAAAAAAAADDDDGIVHIDEGVVDVGQKREAGRRQGRARVGRAALLHRRYTSSPSLLPTHANSNDEKKHGRPNEEEAKRISRRRAAPPKSLADGSGRRPGVAIRQR